MPVKAHRYHRGCLDRVKALAPDAVSFSIVDRDCQIGFYGVGRGTGMGRGRGVGIVESK